MRIDRSVLVAALGEYAQTAHCLVVGEPGVGKTFALTDLYQSLKRAGAGPRYLPVDKLAVGSRAELSAELHIHGDVIDDLAGHSPASGSRPQLLIVDGLDSARSETGRLLYLNVARDVMTQLAGKWHVVVGVRTYDAARSRQLLDLFPHAAGDHGLPQYVDASIRCRHFLVPRLNAKEVSVVVQQNSAMLAAYGVASPELKELLQIPFNLWLLEKLASADVPELSQVSSEVQLLELYWKYRVEEGARANDRRDILVKLTKAMVSEKSLSVRRDSSYVHGWNQDWDELHSSEVLESDKRGLRVSYRHAILFDFAVARLLIEDDPKSLERFVLSDPARPVFLRPSLVYHLTWLWHEKREDFWKVFWHMLPSQDTRLRLFARLLPTSVVLRESRTQEDVQPLVDRMETGDPLALEGLFRLVQAYNALQPVPQPPGWDELWAGVMGRVSVLGGVLDVRAVWGAASITSDILERAEKSADVGIRQACGGIGRRLLDWALERRAREREQVDSFAPVRVFPLFLKTFDENPEQAAAMVGRVLDLLKEEQFPIQYFWVLAEHVHRIWPTNPDLVAEVYFRVFTQRERSEEKTPFGLSAVLPMSSTRRQDYDMVQFVLAEKYAKFLNATPLVAARALVDCMNLTILWEHVIPHLKEGVTPSDLKPEEFDFLGGRASILPDISFIWDESYHSTKPTEMADVLFNYLGHSPDREPPRGVLDDILKLFRDRAVMAFFWRRLLEVGTQHPRVYADRLHELCVAPPVLRCLDTLHELGSFIESAAPLWPPARLEAVERAVLRLPEDAPDPEERKQMEHRRDRLIARIPRRLLQFPEARELRESMEQTDEVPDNEPLFKVGAFRGGEVTDEGWVQQQGAQPEKPQNRRLLDIGKPLDHWARAWHNKQPDKEARGQIKQPVKDAYSALQTENDADKPVVDMAWTHLASACEAVARAEDLSDVEFESCREILLTAARLPTEDRSAEDDAKYNWPGWGGTAQSAAAIGLISLASRKPDDVMLSAIRTLALERYTGVRSPAVRYLGYLYDKSPQFFWKLISEVAASETNAVILAALPSEMWPAVWKEPDSVADVLEKLEPKVAAAGVKMEPDDQFARTVVALAVAKESPKACRMVLRWQADPTAKAALLSRATLAAMEFLTPQLVSDEGRRAEVSRAADLVLNAIKAATCGLVELRRQSGIPMSDEQQQLYREVYGVLEHVVDRVFFESGVFEHRSKDKEPVTPEQLETFHARVKPLLESVLDHTAAAQGGILLAPVAYRFTEYLNGVLKHDPPGVLHMAARVVANSAPAGYNLDSLAVREAIKLAEAILADYRHVAQEGQGLDDLLSMLDAFADAGWPDANRLVWRLDDIFR